MQAEDKAVAVWYSDAEKLVRSLAAAIHWRHNLTSRNTVFVWNDNPSEQEIENAYTDANLRNDAELEQQQLQMESWKADAERLYHNYDDSWVSCYFVELGNLTIPDLSPNRTAAAVLRELTDRICFRGRELASKSLSRTPLNCGDVVNWQDWERWLPAVTSLVQERLLRERILIERAIADKKTSEPAQTRIYPTINRQTQSVVERAVIKQLAAKMFPDGLPATGQHFNDLINYLNNFTGTSHEKTIWDRYYSLRGYTEDRLPFMRTEAEKHGLTADEWLSREILIELKKFGSKLETAGNGTATALHPDKHLPEPAGAKKKNTGNRKLFESGQSELVYQFLKMWHRYSEVDKDGNDLFRNGPVGVNELERYAIEKCTGKDEEPPSRATISRWFKVSKRFGSHKEYKRCCNRNEIEAYFKMREDELIKVFQGKNQPLERSTEDDDIDID
jgi:hypothetical protein